MHLSKSQYCSAIQCPKMLWMKKNKPDVFDDSWLNQAVFDTGNEVGDKAKSLFGEYTEVPFTDFPKMIDTTKKLMEDGVPNICEASFSYDGLFCRVDILRNLGNHEVEVYEVKSSTDRIREIYFHDISFQCYILHKLGYEVRRACLVHINNKYVRQGELDLQQFFEFEDMTEKINTSYDDVAANLSRFEEYLKQTKEPKDDIGVHCHEPYSCGFYTYCTRNFPKPNFFDIPGFRIATKYELYHAGLVSYEDLMESDKLSEKQRWQVIHSLKPNVVRIKKPEIKRFLDGLYYPLYFLDFETFNPAVPIYDKTRPYQQIVFQYSLHYIEKEEGELHHREFLATPEEDPRQKIAERLLSDIPNDACILAYNMTFEQTCIKGLAKLFPEWFTQLMHIHDRIQDLMYPFGRKDYYTSDMQGSYSIKHVLPALFPNDPELNYHNLEGVQNGSDASAAFLQMVTHPLEDWTERRKQLLKYCGLDTFAMVKIWQHLCEVVNQWDEEE